MAVCIIIYIHTCQQQKCAESHFFVKPRTPMSLRRYIRNHENRHSHSGRRPGGWGHPPHISNGLNWAGRSSNILACACRFSLPAVRGDLLPGGLDSAPPRAGRDDGVLLSPCCWRRQPPRLSSSGRLRTARSRSPVTRDRAAPSAFLRRSATCRWSASASRPSGIRSRSPP